MSSEIPPPGSDAALALGCRCPVLDNAHGRGIPTRDGPAYWISTACSLHGSGTRLPVIVAAPCALPWLTPKEARDA